MLDHNSLYDRTGACLAAADPDQKLTLTEALYTDWRQGRLIRASDTTAPAIGEPGRPERPQLVSPLLVERRSMHTPEGRAALFHSMAHIEFNAINLALDAVYRFRDMPRDFVNDWLQVAAEEACYIRGLSLFSARLKSNDDVLLQNIIIFECLATRLEQVHVPNGSTLKDEVTERSVIRPIAKAARYDRYNLPARCRHRYGQRHKGGIKIDGFNSGLTKKQAVT